MRNRRHLSSSAKADRGPAFQTLPFVGPHFTHILTNLSILFCASDDEPLHGKLLKTTPRYSAVEKSLQEADRAPIAEIYRCLLPNGIVAFSSWKSLGWTYDQGHDPGPLGDPLKIYPSNGWRDPEYIRKKLTMHGFDNINITEYPFQNKASPELFETIANSLVRHAVGRLWSAENDIIMNQEDVDDIAKDVIDQHKGRLFTGQMVAWITTARKPPLG